MAYRVWIRTWVEREEVFASRDGAELFRLRLTASQPRLGPADICIVPERVPPASPRVTAGASPQALGPA